MVSTARHPRLPSDPRPRRYAIAVRCDTARRRLAGTTTIEVDCAEPVDRLQLHAADMEVSAATVDGVGADIELLADREMMVVTPRSPLGKGHHTLVLDHACELGEGLTGWYLSRYADDDGEHVVSVTQFEATDARRAFPCWDEPEFKAEFELRIEAPDDHVVIANSREVERTATEPGWSARAFAPTMPMSTYLVAAVTGRFEITDPSDTATDPTAVAGSVPLRIVHRPGQAHLTTFATECARFAVEWFEEYYGLTYPGDKIDLVAVPDFAFGAMENLGCVTFREAYLLVDPRTATHTESEHVALVIAHELAHMWFGDLVTMRWWEGIWLNEAFATFMELSCVDAWKPDWKVWSSFGRQRTRAFAIDELEATRPIEFAVDAPEEAEAMFDVLTYEKGCAVLRMLDRHLGPDVFRRGVMAYLERHAYGSTDGSDLWAALAEASGTDVEAIMGPWIQRGGHPVVMVTASEVGLCIRQERSTAVALPADGSTAAGVAGGESGGPGESGGLWPIPITLRWSRDGRTGTTDLLLTEAEQQIDLGGAAEWVCPNVDAIGFFRSSVEASLAAPIDELNADEQFSAIDDAAALARQGRGDVATLLGVAEHTVNGLEPAVVQRTVGAIDQLRRVAAVDDRQRLDDWWMPLAVAALAAAESAEPSAASAATIAALTGSAATAGDAAALGRCREAVENAEADGPVNPDFLDVALRVVAADADAAHLERWLARSRDSATPQDGLRWLHAAAYIDDDDARRLLIEACLTTVRVQDAPFVVGQGLAGPAGARLVPFTTARYDEMVARWPAPSRERMWDGATHVLDPDVAGMLVRFLIDAEAELVGTTRRAQTLERLRLNRLAGRYLATSLSAALAAH